MGWPTGQPSRPLMLMPHPPYLLQTPQVISSCSLKTLALGQSPLSLSSAMYNTHPEDPPYPLPTDFSVCPTAMALKVWCPKPAASASNGNLVEMQFGWCTPELWNQKL